MAYGYTRFSVVSLQYGSTQIFVDIVRSELIVPVSVFDRTKAGQDWSTNRSRNPCRVEIMLREAAGGKMKSMPAATSPASFGAGANGLVNGPGR